MNCRHLPGWSSQLMQPTLESSSHVPETSQSPASLKFTRLSGKKQFRPRFSQAIEKANLNKTRSLSDKSRRLLKRYFDNLCLWQGFPKTDSQMQICMQGIVGFLVFSFFDGEFSQEQHLYMRKGSRIGQREKLNSSAVATEASAKPRECWITVQSCPKQNKVWTFVSLIEQSFVASCSWEGVQCSYLAELHSEGDSAINHQQLHLQLQESGHPL